MAQLAVIVMCRSGRPPPIPVRRLAPSATKSPTTQKQMKREALEKLNRRANEMSAEKAGDRIGTVSVQ
jgi:hypothetical protein